MERIIMWTAWREPGLEHLRLAQRAGEVSADSVVIGVKARAVFRLHYTLRCDDAWRVREVDLAQLDDSGQSVRLRADGIGHWRTATGALLPDLDGCIDVDIAATPFTNTLPIRRLGLAGGQSAEIKVVYIAVPELHVRPALQRYTRLHSQAAGELYRYESLSSGFTAELPVDADGLVLDYPGIFRRVWSSSEPGSAES